AFLAGVPQSVRVLLVMPPVYYTALPQPGSRQAGVIDACKAALRHVVADRPRGGFLDFRRDVEGTHDATDFVHLVHYREKLAHRVEAAIIERLRSGDVASSREGPGSLPGIEVRPGCR